MPTWDSTASFKRDYKRLSPEQRESFKDSIRDFIEDLKAIEAGTQSAPRPGLRVKPMQGRAGVWEMTWEAADGRATFNYGEPVTPGLRHIVWRRIGSHKVFKSP